MTLPDILLAASARQWGDRLHRFSVDHGGARVQGRVMSEGDVWNHRFDVLLIDDTCSFLSPRLVARVRELGRSVIGVFDPDEFEAGKDRLMDVGVSDVVEAGSAPEEMLAVVHRVGGRSVTAPVLPDPTEPAGRPVSEVIVVAAPPGGCGATEVAIGVAAAIGNTGRSVALVDLDCRAPALAQRLGLGNHPNLMTAVDSVIHRTGSVLACLQPVGAANVGVLAAAGARGPGPADRAAVVDQLARHVDVTVVDLASGAAGESGQTLDCLGGLDPRLVAVSVPTPVGVTRWIRWTRSVGRSVHAAMNRTPSSRFVRSEIARELASETALRSLTFIPDDPAVREAAWNGSVVGRGRFSRACRRLAMSVSGDRR